MKAPLVLMKISLVCTSCGLWLNLFYMLYWCNPWLSFIIFTYTEDILVLKILVFCIKTTFPHMKCEYSHNLNSSSFCCHFNFDCVLQKNTMQNLSVTLIPKMCGWWFICWLQKEKQNNDGCFSGAAVVLVLHCLCLMVKLWCWQSSELGAE